MKKRIRATAKSSQVLAESLSAEEGFLWSQLKDGISLQELTSLVPFSAGDVERALKGLVEKGLAEWMDQAKSQSPTPAPAPEATTLSPKIEALLKADESHPLHSKVNRELRIQILKKWENLDQENFSPYELFDLKVRASAHEIKQRYLELSKLFHPDRFFKTDLGDYKRKVEMIFARIQKANSVLKNPIEREALDRRLALRPSEAGSAKETKKKPMALSPEMELIGKAEWAYKEGLEKQKASDFVGAFNSFTLALQLNPQRENYQKALDHVRPFVHRQRAQEILQQALSLVELDATSKEALRLVDEALKMDSHLSEAQYLSARLIYVLQLKDRFREAKEKALRAKAKLKGPDQVDASFLLAQLHGALGDVKAAMRECEETLKLKPDHSGARKLREKLA